MTGQWNRWYQKLCFIKSALLKQTQKKTMKKTQLHVHGFTAEGFQKVRQTFQANLDAGLERGGSFAVYYRGELVVNLWGGYSDYESRRLWKEDTLSTFFSSTKALAAFVIAHLADRGLLDYKERVSLYWPEFAQNGKEQITVEQLISNQAGLITLDKPFWLAELHSDPSVLGQKLAEQKPFWTPGEKHGYHPLTFGLYLDQLVRHVDPAHRCLADYFQEEIAKPFDIELYIGLPKALCHRATRVVLPKNMDQSVMLQNFKGDLELLMMTGRNPQDFKSVLSMNNPDIRELPVPSTHGHATAANFAKLFGIVANRGKHNGKTFLSMTAIERFTRPIVAGIDCSFGMDAAWSVGTHLITMVTGNHPPVNIFGHGGYGGQYAASDMRHQVGFAYTTGFLDPFSSYSTNGDQRMYSLVNAMYDCVFHLENIKEERRLFPFHSQYQCFVNEKQSASKL
ncbi:beta-lactamase domain-containing protein 2-like isoform X2 [Dreissena polymorpha]|nr:beta-lactamase domain-containing protein 2-like isoform X2 [Dreissena polymorpha]XP_052218809.1 beta-lactamase domain-containing protein 2-like isoform X2 [Dreissena polymorpha]XP_052218820.1 beta-lactamase domain-containing protein 2-like isoform X2 [Dreissena polymorpha]XP_052218831.1 beta-lactamase domain-containing protein 2-like isoform X2 [Dreissena polymorpha]XP_052218842.1 beta-lactamase domain-containing protein 2-like isoform X2 [Dreissena polymorpha]XP_052218853.1 beta-lactamase 